MYTIEKQIEINNKVQQRVPDNLVEKFFNDGHELWYFIEDYELVTKKEFDEDWIEDDGYEENMSQEEASEKLGEPLFPMSCVGLPHGDTLRDIPSPKHGYYLPTASFLEFNDGGDGVEYEYWKHSVTQEVYKVPIEIVRDFDNLEKI
tara:strand:- start:347 stop:787 length:441 start_codon:yes stop_codon:yes gene_type:complete